MVRAEAMRRSTARLAPPPPALRALLPSRGRRMNRLVSRYPVWSLIIAAAAVAVIWLVFAPWPPGFEAVFGKKKLFLNAAFNGITLGGLYFLVASGFTLIFGLMRNVNLAHGSIYLLGGYFGYMTVDATGSWLFSFVVAFLVAALLGVLLAGRRLPPDGRTGPSSDAGHDRHFDRACRPDALGFRWKLLADTDAGLAAWTDGASLRHRGQVFRRGRLSFLSDRPSGHLRRLGRDWPCDVARAQPHPNWHDRTRRRRRPRHALGDGRAHPARFRDRLRVRSRAGRHGGRGRAAPSSRSRRARTRGFCWRPSSSSSSAAWVRSPERRSER